MFATSPKMRVSTFIHSVFARRGITLHTRPHPGDEEGAILALTEGFRNGWFQEYSACLRPSFWPAFGFSLACLWPSLWLVFGLSSACPWPSLWPAFGFSLACPGPDSGLSWPGGCPWHVSGQAARHDQAFPASTLMWRTHPATGLDHPVRPVC